MVRTSERSTMVGKTDMVPDFLGLKNKYINIKYLALSETI